MPSKKTEEILALCEKGTVAVTEYTTSKSKMLVVCVNGHTRDVTPEKIKSRGDKSKCRECGTYVHYLSKTQGEFELDCAKYNLEPVGTYKNNTTRVLVRNSVCGHEYEINPNSMQSKGSGTSCKVCNTTSKDTIEAVTSSLLSKGLELVGGYYDTSSKARVYRPICGHTFSIDISSLIYKECYKECPECIIGLKPVEEVIEVLKGMNLELVGKYNGTKEPITIKNITCGHTHTVSLASNLFHNRQGVVCRVCNPLGSEQELDLLKFIKQEYSGWIITNDRKMLGGKELDIIIPDLGIAIEYNGSYWHRETEIRDKNYHLNKLQGVLDYEYKLLTITDVEWLLKRSIVESRLKAIIGTSKNKIFARTTEVREIKFPKDFLNTNHIQGAGAPTKYNYGLFTNNILVAVMTFSTPRFNKKYTYELVRFCSILNTSIVGGASKLLKYFKKFNTGSIISYADRRWSTGEVYKVLGFTFSHNSVPSYTYMKGLKILSRYQCQKHLLSELFPEYYEVQLSESQIMSNAGYYKIYDCGNSVWVLE